jgi:hypothetical protein
VKKLILLLLVVLIVFAVWNRERLYVRDPLAHVTRDAAKESAQVFINFDNDVLLENDTAPTYVLLVQHGRPLSVPSKMRCVHWVACLMDSDAASLLPLGAPATVMTNRTVQFLGPQHQPWKVTLR